MTTVDVLRIARERLAKGYTKKLYAIDASGQTTACWKPAAVAYCIEGAVNSTWREDRTAEGLKARSGADKVLRKALPPEYWNVVEFNDAEVITQQDVVALFDRAIILAEATAEPGA